MKGAAEKLSFFVWLNFHRYIYGVQDKKRDVLN
jgi:hypothetical protein